MKLPQSAPAFSQLVGDPGFADVLSAFGTLITQEDAYWHWDDFRFRPQPEQFSLETWWTLLKLQRVASRQILPLPGVDGIPASFGLPNTAQALLWKLDRHLAHEQSFFDALPPLAPEHKKNYRAEAGFEEALASAQLEGAEAEPDVVKLMLATERTPENAAEQAVANIHQAREFIRERVAEPLTPALLLELHRRITENAFLETGDVPGRLRQDEDNILLTSAEGELLFAPPPAAELPERLERLCDFFNETATARSFVHPLVRAILVHFWLAYDHPFVDGNGRTARALFYWAALRQGYAPVEYLSLSQAILQYGSQYYKSFLLVETDETDTTYFLLNQLGMIEKALEGFYAYVQTKQEALGTLTTFLSQLTWINARQEQLLLHALKHPGAVYTIESQQGFHKVSFPTARNDLLQLVKAGFLTLRRTRPFKFISPVDLSERIQTAKPPKR